MGHLRVEICSVRNELHLSATNAVYYSDDIKE